MDKELNVYEDLDRLKVAVIHIRKESVKGNMVEKLSLMEAAGIEEKDLDAMLERVLEFPEMIDLRRVTDNEGIEYLYSGTEMSEKYAEILMGVKNRDLMKLIADTVRYESRVYPRTTQLKLFTKKPYLIEEDVLIELLDNMGENSEYSDLKYTEASNGTKFIYSTKYLDPFYAGKLTEWNEVLQKEIP